MSARPCWERSSNLHGLFFTIMLMIHCSDHRHSNLIIPVFPMTEVLVTLHTSLLFITPLPSRSTRTGSMIASFIPGLRSIPIKQHWMNEWVKTSCQINTCISFGAIFVEDKKRIMPRPLQDDKQVQSLLSARLGSKSSDSVLYVHAVWAWRGRRMLSAVADNTVKLWSQGKASLLEHLITPNMSMRGQRFARL